MIISQLGVDIIRPWGQFMTKADEADITGSAVLIKYKVTYHLLGTLTGGYKLSDDDIKKLISSTENHDDIDDFNAILVLDKDDKDKIIDNFKLDKGSVAQLKRCDDHKYCYCATRIYLTDNEGQEKIILDRDNEQTIFTVPSIVTGDDFSVYDCLENKVKTIKFFACTGKDYQIKYGGSQVKIIQYFYTRTLFFNKDSSSDKDVINIKFIDDCGDFDLNKDCTIVTSECPYVSVEGGGW